MNCPICGADNASESTFCISCGSQLPAAQSSPAASANPFVAAEPMAAPVATAPYEQTTGNSQFGDTAKAATSKIASIFKNPKVRFGIIGVAAVLLLIFIFSALFSGNGFIKYKEEIRVVQSEEGEYSVIVGKKVLKTTIKSDEGISSLDSSLNGKVAAILTGEKELYVVKGSKVKKVAEDVRSYELSVDGDGIAYAVRSEDDEDSSLYLAKVSNVKSTKITGNLGRNYVIAPDGKTVAYYEDGGEEDPDELMLYNGKKSTSICDDENSYLYGMSNGGKQIYVSLSKESDGDYKTDLYSFNKKGEKTKLGSLDGNVRFNDDHTQVMFDNEDEKTYISTKGKEAVKASNGSLRLIIAPGSCSMDDTYPVSNLYNHVYRSYDEDDKAYEAHLIKKKKDIKLVSKASNLQLDGDAEYLYYLYDNEEIRYIKISKGEKASEKAKTIIREDAEFLVTSDRKYVYYQDGDDTLMCINGKKGGTPKEISDDVDFSSGVALSQKDIFYYVVDDDLYAVSNGKKGKKVLSDVDYTYSGDNGYVYAYNDDEFFVSTGSKKLKKVVDLYNEDDD